MRQSVAKKRAFIQIFPVFCKNSWHKPLYMLQWIKSKYCCSHRRGIKKRRQICWFRTSTSPDKLCAGTHNHQPEFRRRRTDSIPYSSIHCKRCVRGEKHFNSFVWLFCTEEVLFGLLLSSDLLIKPGGCVSCTSPPVFCFAIKNGGNAVP